MLEEKIDAESHIYAGKTSEEILLAAKEYDASLIIMGVSSKNAIEKYFPVLCLSQLRKKPLFLF